MNLVAELLGRGKMCCRACIPCWASALLALHVTLAGCAHAPLNQPLAKYTPNDGFRYTPPADENASDVAFFLFFSGGGKRASALSYGVLKELAETKARINGRDRRLLDQVELISAVSGGSFTAAYYALHHDGIFKDFESRYLKRNVQAALERTLFFPFHWPALASPYYGRSDLVANYYDEHLFDHATFGDLIRAGGRPFLMINATDMASGEQFTFSQIRFDLLSSDLSSYPLARAVAASSAVPVLLTPITLKNYAGTLGEVQSVFLPTTDSGEDRERPLREKELRRLMRAYADRNQYPYIHLMDGGLSDNLGIRSFANACILQGGLKELMSTIRMRSPRKLVVIVVNAAARKGGEWAKREDVPGILDSIHQLSDVIGVQANRRSIEIFQPLLDEWRRQEINRLTEDAKGRGEGLQGPKPDYYFVTVTFESIPSLIERTFFQNLPSNFQLPEEAIDKLTETAALLLRDSREYQRLLEDLSSGK